jgi:[ribosomal protein S5]-alanine N-acetyltransferase
MVNRIRLAPLTGDDLSLFIALCTNPAVMQHVYSPFSEHQAKAVFTERLRPWHHLSDGWLSFVICHHADGQKLGTIGLKIVDHQRRVAEIGFMLLPQAQGRGFAAEAAEQLVSYAFLQLQLKKLIAICAAANTGSVKLLQKLGFTLEQQLANNSQINGVPVDDVQYALAKVKWQSMHHPLASRYNHQ